MTTVQDRTDTALTEAITRTEGHISRADSKAGQIMTVTGLLATVGTVIAPNAHGPALAAIGTAALTGTVSFALALWTILPRLGTRGCTPDRNSFVYWATAAPTEITDSITGAQRSDTVRVLAVIALRKMRLLRYAAVFALLAVAALGAAGLTR
ncbi:Pycsar system effector family protein [Streptomyces sp. NPDC005900]|uniref:Pycsar system effector family protein n=1 Tax=Streptomyces sp. NPDC005900 TaxID=3154569 RepID=UPI0033E67647